MCEKYPLENLNFLVIDEADKLFELGFLEQLDAILSHCPDNNRISKFLFSATMQPGVEEIVRGVMTDALKVQIGIRNSTATTVDQKIVYTGREEGKLLALRQIIRDGFEPPMLIFV